MMVKIIEKSGREVTYPCSHIGVETVTEEMIIARGGASMDGGKTALQTKEPGITIELCGRHKPPHEVRLPRDGEVAYVMNDKGDTTDSYRWPPKGGS